MENKTKGTNRNFAYNSNLFPISGLDLDCEILRSMQEQCYLHTNENYFF